jgi:DNA mismatch repair ATPase MutL
MRAFRLLNLALLSVLVTSSAALYAQDEKQQEDKPRQEEPKRQDEPKRPEEPKQQDEAKPASRQDEMKTPRQDEAKPSKQEQKQEEKQSREEMKQGRQEPQEGRARPEGKGGHIPDDRFHAQFGRSHTFRAQRPVVVEGQPRFEYSGYTFVLIDAWPADWAYTDDCYVDYIDGEYFLFDLLHPGMRIALFVVM